jgi:pyruvyl transferase EpsO
MTAVTLPSIYARQLSDIFERLIPRTGPLAHLDFPDHDNSGDSAIWLGERALLDRLGLDTAYRCSVATYDRAALAAQIGAGTILMHGGGNFGDRWREHQEFRLRVLRDFPQNKVIVFPQTAGFLDNAYLRECRQQFAKHPDVTLCARDVVSHQLLKTYFSPAARVELVTDMAFMIGFLKRPTEPQFDIVWLARTDHESMNREAVLATTKLGATQPEKFAFPLPVTGLAMGYVGRRRGNRLLLTDWIHASFSSSAAKAAYDGLEWDRKSKLHVDRAAYLLSLGRLVVTDRLHAHILCILLRIPHIFLNNDYGKNWNFYDTWTRETPLCRLAQNPAEAWKLAQLLAGGADAKP